MKDNVVSKTGRSDPQPPNLGGSEVYRIGRLGRTHGVKGELSFQFDDDVFDRADADCLILRIDGLLVPFFIEEYRFRSDTTCILKLEGIDTQERARQLTGCDVFFLRRLTPAEDEDELRWNTFIGYDIVDGDADRVVGRIAAVNEQTYNILFELEDGTLIPAAEDLITDVDQQARRITMQLPEGLLEL